MKPLEGLRLGKHRLAHKGEKETRKWKSRIMAKIARASRQKNRRLTR